jgi:hypothetical protein
MTCRANREYPKKICLGALAQLVEQRTFNPFVVGSTPAGPTKYQHLTQVRCFLFGFLAQLVEQRTLNP